MKIIYKRKVTRKITHKKAIKYIFRKEKKRKGNERKKEIWKNDKIRIKRKKKEHGKMTKQDLVKHNKRKKKRKKKKQRNMEQ